jgi:hypothetical protein
MPARLGLVPVEHLEELLLPQAGSPSS